MSFRITRETPLIVALSLAALPMIGCGQRERNQATADGGTGGAGAGGGANAASGGLEIDVPPVMNIDCDAALPLENHAPLQPSDPLCEPSAATASFSKDVAPIVGSCSGEVCHVPWTYDALVGVHSTFCCDKRFLVDPYAPSESALVQALLGTNPCVGQMPPGRPFARGDLQPVIDWVCQGAVEN